MKEFIPPLLDIYLIRAKDTSKLLDVSNTQIFPLIYLIRAMQLNVLKKEIISLSIPILGNIPMQCTLLHQLQC